jgi:hypothetical protein
MSCQELEKKYGVDRSVALEKKLILELAEFFNKRNPRVYDDNTYVLTRIICAAKEIFGVECDVIIPKDTVFVRTCKSGEARGGACHHKTFFESRTTFCNLSPLSNLNIQNAYSSKTNKNDHVIFLRNKEELRFFDFNKVSQLVGTQTKMGEKPGKNLWEGRGFFGACCVIKDMEYVCNYFGYDGVTQCDIADAFYTEDNPNEDLLPESMQNESEARQYANNLVIEAIQTKQAYPIYAQEGKVIGAMFPEFNIHLGGDKIMAHIFDLIVSVEDEYKSDISLELLSYNPESELSLVTYENPNPDLQFLTHPTVDAEVMTPGAEITSSRLWFLEPYKKRFKISWEIQILCRNKYESYFSINLNKYYLQGAGQWIGKKHEDDAIYYVNDLILIRRCLFGNIYLALPYLSIDNEIGLRLFVDLMTTTTEISLPRCEEWFAIKDDDYNNEHPRKRMKFGGKKSKKKSKNKYKKKYKKKKSKKKYKKKKSDKKSKKNL